MSSLSPSFFADSQMDCEVATFVECSNELMLSECNSLPTEQGNSFCPGSESFEALYTKAVSEPKPIHLLPPPELNPPLRIPADNFYNALLIGIPANSINVIGPLFQTITPKHEFSCHLHPFE